MANHNSIEFRLKNQLHIDGETWKPIVGFEDLYEVSDHGRVRRVQTGLILSPGRSTRGYQNVGLCKNGKVKRVHIHWLVMAAFVGKRPRRAVINHINEKPDDNRLVNLEYVTQKYNVSEALRLKRERFSVIAGREE